MEEFECAGFQVRKQVLVAAPWGEKPMPLGAECECNMSDVTWGGVKLSMLLLENGSHQLVTGQAGCEVDQAVESVLCRMLVGEESQLELSSSYAHVSFRLRLDMLKNPPAWPTTDQALEAAQFSKQVGVTFFQQGRTEHAFLQFSQAYKTMVLAEVDSPEAKDLSATLCNNMAACHLRRGNYEHAATLADLVLLRFPSNPKALYRRGEAALHLRDFIQAESYLQQVIKLQPGNSQAANLLSMAQTQFQGEDEQYRAMARRMFPKQ